MMPTQFWRTEDGLIFDTEEKAIEYEKLWEKMDKIINLYNESPDSWPNFIIKNWDNIKSITEPQA